MARDTESTDAAQVPDQHDAAVTHDADPAPNQLATDVDTHSLPLRSQTTGVPANGNNDEISTSQQHDGRVASVQGEEEHPELAELATQDHGVVSNVPPTEEKKKKKKKNKTRSAGQRGLVRLFNPWLCRILILLAGQAQWIRRLLR